MRDFVCFLCSLQSCFIPCQFLWRFGGKQRGRSSESGDDEDWFICLSLYQQTSFGKSTEFESILFGVDKDRFICSPLQLLNVMVLLHSEGVPCGQVDC